ncbi:MAG: coproporphyrinogen-III oxidase family protein [Verrucomicrobiota bacterium]
MTATPELPEILAATDDDTKAGNYFISNYPPFSFWSEQQVPAVDDLLDRPAPADVPLGVYFHVPFCRKRCHFCYFRVYTDKNADEISRYLEAGLAEMERTARRPYLAGRRPAFVYFGGGTPSYLSPKQLRLVTDRMKELLPWDDVEEVAFEAEPGTLNERKLDTLREIGITRLSMGFENFDDHVLEINGRAHRSREIDRAWRYARGLGFRHINIDLIAGMVEETPENWRENVKRTIAMEPDSVTIYQMEVPYNTGIYKEMKEAGRLVAPVAGWKTKRDWVAEAFAELEAAGYTVTSGYTAVRDPSRHKFVYRDLLWTGSDLLGLGVASFGHLGGVHYQNLTHIEGYIDAVNQGRLPLNRAYVTDPEERLIREFVLQLKLGRLRPSYFTEKFGADVRMRFAEQLEPMFASGILYEDGDEWRLTRAALLRIDALLQGFFLPRHRTDRIV